MSVIDFLSLNHFAFVICSGVLGLIVGSFINVIIHRLPVMMENEWRQECASLFADSPSAETTPPQARYNLVTPRSRCPNCEHMISATENIPLLSYILQRGRCTACSWRIPIRYPLVELLSALLTMAVAVHFGFGIQAGMAMVLTWFLISLSFIDFDTQLLPDSLTLPLLWIGLALGIAGVFIDPRTSLIGAMAGYATLWSVFQLFRLVTGKEGMGFGDFKLLSALGAWMGWQLLPAIIMLSSIAGAVIGVSLMVFRGRDKNIPIPFGPYIAIAGWIALLWGHDLTDAYLSFSGIKR